MDIKLPSRSTLSQESTSTNNMLPSVEIALSAILASAAALSSIHGVAASSMTKRDCSPRAASEGTNGNALTCTGQATSIIDYDQYMQDSKIPTACGTETADAPKFMVAILNGNRHCGEKIEITNPHDDTKKVTATVVDNCVGSCDEYGVGASMLINQNTFDELFGKDTLPGLYDVKYDELQSPEEMRLKGDGS